MDQSRFTKLLVVFTASYLKLYGESVADRQADCLRTPGLASEEELLYFTLFSVTSGLTYDLLGLVSGMDASNAKRNQELGLRVLDTCLADGGWLPKREFKDAAEFGECLKNEDTLIFDGTEQRMHRPAAAEQRNHYSGKKRPYDQGDDFEYAGPTDSIRELLLDRKSP